MIVLGLTLGKHGHGRCWIGHDRPGQVHHELGHPFQATSRHMDFPAGGRLGNTDPENAVSGVAQGLHNVLGSVALTSKVKST